MPGQYPNRASSGPLRQHGGIRRAVLFTILSAIGLIGVYAIAGSYIGVWLIDRSLADYRAAALNRTALFQTARFNPFTLTAEITGVEITDDANGFAFAARRLRADFSAVSAFRWQPVISTFTIESPDLRLGSATGLTDVLERIRNSPLHHARIERLVLSDGSYSARLNGDRPLESTGIELRLDGFEGSAGGNGGDGGNGGGSAGRYSFSAESPAGATMESSGTLAASLQRADGQIRIAAADIAAIPGWFAGIVESVDAESIVLGGRVTLDGDVSITRLATSPKIELTAAIELADGSLAPAAGITMSLPRANAVANLVITMEGDSARTSGRIAIDDASLAIQYARVTPPQAFELSHTAAVITADEDSGALAIDISGALAGAGDVTLVVSVPEESAGAHSVSIEAADLPAAMLSPYAAQMLGRGLAAGRADVGLDYSLQRDRIDGQLGLVGRELVFEDPAPDPVPAEQTGPGARSEGDTDALELAAALVEDTEGVVALDLPFAANSGSVRAALTAALDARILALTSAPFDTLLPLVADARGTAAVVRFPPGDAALDDSALTSISRIAEFLTARPRLGLRIHGGYEPIADREALATQQIQLHVLLATAGPSAQARSVPVDFASPRAQDVLDEFAGERLPARRFGDIVNRFECEAAPDSPCTQAYYAAIFDALVANEVIAETTLNRLGRFRAQSVADILRQAGIEARRIEVASGAPTVDGRFGVGLPVELITRPADR